MSYSAAFLQQGGGPGLTFQSRRSPVYGTRGMVACSQPLAAEAGLRVLQAGGNAADAAVAIAAALGVTEPGSTGIGGDAFALFYSAKDRQVSCLQGNGAAPAGLSLAAVRAAGVAGNELPHRSPLTVSVPGAAALWEDAVKLWGSGMSLSDVLTPAIELAEQGFPVGVIAAADWAAAAPLLQQAAAAGGAAGLAAAQALLSEDGAAPRPGQLWKNPDLAHTYRLLAEHGAAQGFYRGPVAEAVVAALQSRGGVMQLDDLAAHRSLQVEALNTTYRGLTVWEVPPPTAGVVALMALNVLEAHRQQHEGQPGAAAEPDVEAGAGAAAINLGGAAPRQQRWTPDQMHVAIEACRMAFADALARVADPLAAEQPVDEMISRERAAQRYQHYFDPQRACRPAPCENLAAAGPPKRVKGGDTCQWVVVDGQGNAASFINSIYMQFGTGIIPEGTGFCLQNRCHGFTLDPGHPNSLAPGKRPYHTIIPALLTDADGDLVAAFGVMGAYMQPQGHVQILFNMLELGMDPQAALDTPRFCVQKIDSAVGPCSVLDSHVLLEEGALDEEGRRVLAAKGHRLEVVAGAARGVFGKGQVVVRVKGSGVLVGGSDPRGDGCALGW